MKELNPVVWVNEVFALLELERVLGVLESQDKRVVESMTECELLTWDAITQDNALVMMELDEFQGRKIS